MYGIPGHLQEMMVRAAELLFSSGVMQHGGHGSMSARLEDDRMLLTSKWNLRGLTADDLAVVSFDSFVVTGQIDPSTAEMVAMHAGVYQARQPLRSVIHTHSPHATAFALAHEPLPCAYEGLLRFGAADVIPVAAWAPRGSEESVTAIAKQLEEHPSTPAVLLANHGLLAFGHNPMEAARLVIMLEEAARATLGARILGGERAFPPAALERERERMTRLGSNV